MQKGKKLVKDEHGRPESRETQTRSELLRRNSSQLHNSEIWYRALFENANDAIFLMDYDQFIDCNPKTLEMFNCTKEQIIGRRPYDRFSPRLQPDGQTSKDKALEKIKSALDGRPQFFEWRHQRYDGTPFEAEVSLNRVEIFKHFYLQAFVRDITKRKKAEQSVRESEKQYRSLFENMPAVCFTFDREGRFLSWNHAAEKVYGYTKAEAVGTSAYELIVTDKTKKTTDEVIQSVFEGKTIRGTEWQDRDKHGNIGWRMGNSFPLFRADGSVDCGVNLNIDITEHKQAEEELLRARQDWKNIFQAIGQPSFILDPQHRIIAANRAAEKKTGLSVEQLKGRKCFELLHGIKRPPEECPMEKMLCSGSAETVEMEIEAFGGIYLVSCTPFYEAKGRLEKVIHIATDITERKIAEQKLREHEEQLKSLASELSLAEERERRRIAAGIHDDISQRLAFTKLELQLMQNTISDSNVILSLKKQCGTIDRLMEDVRSLTFELSNPLLYEIGLEAAIESFLREQIKDKFGIKCKFISQGPQINLEEDIRIVLYQGVRELLTNIVKHAGASRIEVRIVRSNTQISIIVDDDGIGLDLSKLGSPERNKGGFGLFNIKERLEYLGGNLNIQSKPNKGTRVTMSIPLKLKTAVQQKEILP